MRGRGLREQHCDRAKRAAEDEKAAAEKTALRTEKDAQKAREKAQKSAEKTAHLKWSVKETERRDEQAPSQIYVHHL